MDSDFGFDQSYRTCAECGQDCPPEPFEVDGRLLIGFACDVHGVHAVVDPHEKKL